MNKLQAGKTIVSRSETYLQLGKSEPGAVSLILFIK